MKWIGQYIQSLISRFRNDVYLEATETGTIASGGNLGLDSNNKIVKSASPSGTIDLTSEVTGTLPVSSGGTGATTLADNSVLTGTGTSAISAESNLTFDGSTLTATCPSVVFEHSVSGQLTVKNTGNNTTPGTIKLENTRGGNAGQDSDSTGSIVFFGNNDAGSPALHKFAEILASSNDVTADQEAGELLLKVAEFDGTVTTGLKLDGDTNANGEVDVTIGAGVASTTIIAGNAKINGSELFGPLDSHLSIKSDTDLYFIVDHDNDSTAASFAWYTNGNASTNTKLMSLTDDAKLTVGGEGSGGAGDITIANSVSDATGPTLTLHSQRGASGSVSDAQDDDVLGAISFSGYDDGTPLYQEYVKMESTIADASNSDEAGKLDIQVATESSLRSALTLTGQGTSSRVSVGLGYGTSSITSVAGDLTVTSKATMPTRKLSVTAGSSAGEHDGDVVYTGTTSSMVAGDLYVYNSSGNWVLANAAAENTTKGLLAIALGTDSDTHGMLLRGMVTSGAVAGTPDEGAAVYIRATAGDITTVAPSTSGQFVRVIGYCMENSNNRIYFNPDNTYIELA